MVPLLFIAAVNTLFLGGVLAAYFLVTRRRTRVFSLIEHLASLVKRGMPLAVGLRTLGEDLGGYFGLRLGRVARGVEEGRSLAEALEAEPRALPPLVKNMVALGERNGNLAGFLEELRRSYRRITEQPYQSVYFFLYPVILSVFINLALTGLYTFIHPKFEMIFEQILTREPRLDVPTYAWAWPWVMGANEVVLVASILLALFVFLGGGSVHFAAFPLWRLKRLADHGVLLLPFLRRLIRQRALHAFSLATGLLLRAGASLPAAARAAAEAETNVVLSRRLAGVARKLNEGARLGAACREVGLFRDDFLWFVDAGEAAGDLPGHLLQAAAHYETQARFLSQVASRAVVPGFVVLNGSLVLATCVLTVLPLRRLLESVGPW